MTHPSLIHPLYMAGKKKEEPVSNSDPVVTSNNVFLASGDWIGTTTTQGFGVVTTDHTGAPGAWHDCAGGRVFIPSQQQFNQQLACQASFLNQQALLIQQTQYHYPGLQHEKPITIEMADTLPFSLEEIEEAQEFIQKLNADRQQLPAH